MIQQPQPQISFENNDALSAILQRLDDIEKRAVKGIWSLEDVATYLGKSASYVYGLMKISHLNQFPMPRRMTVDNKGEVIASSPYWLPKEIENWVKSQTKDLAVAPIRRRSRCSKS